MHRTIFIFSLFFPVIGVFAESTQVVQMKNAKGEDIGTVKLTNLTNGVKLNLDLRGLSPGEHAVHFHQTGKCEGPKFDSAGGHFAPANNPHGFDMKGGPHAGDLPNITVAADGTAKVEFISTGVTLGKGQNSLLKKEGTSIIVHASADDYKSQPAGAAGDRVACGQIKAMSRDR